MYNHLSVSTWIVNCGAGKVGSIEASWNVEL